MVHSPTPSSPDLRAAPGKLSGAAAIGVDMPIGLPSEDVRAAVRSAGKPAAGEHVFVVTHRPPTDWAHADTAPFTFDGGVEKATAAAKEFAGDRLVDLADGQIGSQALKLGLIDQVVVNQVPVIFGSGRPFFATGRLAEPLRLENPTTIVPGDRVTHFVYDVSR
jgi:dihydrofolate reductase